MIKTVLLCIIMACFTSCLDGRRGLNRHSLSDLHLIDSLKKVSEITDSIKVLYYDSTGLTVFIDYNLNSIYHQQQKKRFSYPIYDSAYIREYIERLPPNKKSFKKTIIPSSLKTTWIPLLSYKSNYFIYYDCDFQTCFEINDSTFCQYGIMPIDPIKIDSLIVYKNQFNILSPENKSTSFPLSIKKSLYTS